MIFGLKEKELPRRPLSLKETALLAGVTEKTIRHEVADRVAQPHRGDGRRLQFEASSVIYFGLVSALRVSLSKLDRKHLFALITNKQTENGPWRLKGSRLTLTGSIPVEIRVEEVASQLLERIKLFLTGMDRVVSSPDLLGGEPVFQGTRVSVRHVGQLVHKGVPEAELIEDFPSLTKDDLAFARLFVSLGKPPGRPRKKLRFVRGTNEPAH